MSLNVNFIIKVNLLSCCPTFGVHFILASAFYNVVLIVVFLTNQPKLYNDWLDFHDAQTHQIQI